MTTEQLDEIQNRVDGWVRTGLTIYAEGVADRAQLVIDALREALARCDTLRGLADEKAHESGLYARRMEQAQQARRTGQAKALREARVEVERLNGKLLEEARWVYDTGQRAKDAQAEVERLRSAISRFVSQYPWQDGPEIQELKALKERE